MQPIRDPSQMGETKDIYRIFVREMHAVVLSQEIFTYLLISPQQMEEAFFKVYSE